MLLVLAAQDVVPQLVENTAAQRVFVGYFIFYIITAQFYASRIAFSFFP